MTSNEILFIAIGAFFSFCASVISGVLVLLLRGHRDRIDSVEAKTNENAEAIARIEGLLGRLGTHQNWRE